MLTEAGRYYKGIKMLDKITIPVVGANSFLVERFLDKRRRERAYKAIIVTFPSRPFLLSPSSDAVPSRMCCEPEESQHYRNNLVRILDQMPKIKTVILAGYSGRLGQKREMLWALDSLRGVCLDDGRFAERDVKIGCEVIRLTRRDLRWSGGSRFGVVSSRR
jgi:hypothetical protein